LRLIAELRPQPPPAPENANVPADASLNFAVSGAWKLPWKGNGAQGRLISVKTSTGGVLGTYPRLAIALFTIHPHILKQGGLPLVRAAENDGVPSSPFLSNFRQQSYYDYSQK
jgi:hypothetical protein